MPSETEATVVQMQEGAHSSCLSAMLQAYIHMEKAETAIFLGIDTLILLCSPRFNKLF